MSKEINIRMAVRKMLRETMEQELKETESIVNPHPEEIQKDGSEKVIGVDETKPLIKQEAKKDWRPNQRQFEKKRSSVK